MKYKNRIKGYVELPGSRILPNPKNWRTHNDKQRDVLRGLMAEVGVVDAVLVRPVDDAALASLRKVKAGDVAAFSKWIAAYDGDFMLIDGHLRAEEIRDQPLSALVLDLDEREAAEILATFDPVGDLAGMDREKFLALAGDFNSASAAVQAMVADLAHVETRMAADAREASREPERREREGRYEEPDVRPDEGDSDETEERDSGLPPEANGREYDESVADEVKTITCPHCGKLLPAPK